MLLQALPPFRQLFGLDPKCNMARASRPMRRKFLAYASRFRTRRNLQRGDRRLGASIAPRESCLFWSRRATVLQLRDPYQNCPFGQ
jgi:hypothetical protein